MDIKAIFKTKLFEIFFDKFLMAVLIVVAGFIFNNILEHNKTINNLSGESAKQFIAACDEIWKEIYNVEFDSNDIVRSSITFFMIDNKLHLAFEEHPENIKKIKQMLKEYDAIFAKINSNTFIIGKDLSRYFTQYVALQRQVYEAEIKSNTELKEQDKKDAKSVAEVFQLQLQKMKFSLIDAQNMAVNKFIN